MLAIFFTDIKPAMPISTIIWFASYIPFSVTHVGYDIEPDYPRIVLYMFPNSAMAYGVKLLFLLELMTEKALDDSTLWNGLFPYNILSIGNIVEIMLYSSLLYLAIFTYLVPVCPGTCGMASPVYYPFTTHFWSRRRSTRMKVKDDIEGGPNEVELSNFEDEPEDRKPGIVIKNLTKKYGNYCETRPAAINKLSLAIYQDEVTVLCGANGCGKTTLLLILTGMIKAT